MTIFQAKTSEETEAVISLVEESGQGDESPKRVNKSVILIGSDLNDIQEYVTAKERKTPIKQLEISEPRSSIDIKIPETEETSKTKNVPNEEIFGDHKINLDSLENREDLSSDTDSGVESEKKISLDDYTSVVRGQEVESSDTDSWGTPANSPAKGRQSSISASLHGLDLCKYFLALIYINMIYTALYQLKVKGTNTKVIFTIISWSL
jgi:hypothetical protein